MTEIQRERINSRAPEGQSVFIENWGILYDIQEPIICARFEAEEVDFKNQDSFLFHSFKILDVVLEEICPKITLLHYKKIFDLIHYKEDREENITWYVYYITVARLEHLLSCLGYII